MQQQAPSADHCAPNDPTPSHTCTVRCGATLAASYNPAHAPPLLAGSAPGRL
jgi:hypothetical protein